MYQFISDPGHSWLKVPLSEIEGMKFTSYSFHDSKFAYLEEDCDAPKFMRERGLTFSDISEVYVDSFNRNMRRFNG